MTDKFLTLVTRTCLISLFVFLTLGCSKRYHDLPAFSPIPVGDPFNESVGRFKTSYLADQINAYFRGNVNAPIAVATFVDIDNLYSASTFGRVLSEQLMSELTMRGYTVIEMRQSEAMQVSYREGEFGLSRDVALLKPSQEVSAVVVGTYAVSPVRVYLNARVIDPRSSVITSVGSVEMGKTDEIARMLRTRSYPMSLERIPVRQFGNSVFPEHSAGTRWSVPSNQALSPDSFNLMVPKQPLPNTGSMKGPVAPTLEPTS